MSMMDFRLVSAIKTELKKMQCVEKMQENDCVNVNGRVLYLWPIYGEKNI